MQAQEIVNALTGQTLKLSYSTSISTSTAGDFTMELMISNHLLFYPDSAVITANGVKYYAQLDRIDDSIFDITATLPVVSGTIEFFLYGRVLAGNSHDLTVEFREITYNGNSLPDKLFDVLIENIEGDFVYYRFPEIYTPFPNVVMPGDRIKWKVRIDFVDNIAFYIVTLNGYMRKIITDVSKPGDLEYSFVIDDDMATGMYFIEMTSSFEAIFTRFLVVK